MDRSTDQPDDAAQFADEAAATRADREALLVEQAEWEQVRTQVESGLADLERRLLQQVERLRAPRDAEEFRVALKEQLALAIERTEVAEARHAEMQAEREELVAALAEATDDQNASIRQERDELRLRLDEALADLAAVSNNLPVPDTDHSARDGEAEAELANLRAQLSVQGEANASALAEMRRQRDEAESRLEEASDRLLSIAGADGELARLRRENDALNSELKAHQQQSERADALAAECDALRESVAQMGSERDGLAAAIEQHASEREELVTQLAIADQTASALEAVQQERDELAEQSHHLQAEAERLRLEVEAVAEGATQQLEAERARVVEAGEKLAVAEQASLEAESLRDELEAAQQNLRKQRDRVSRLEAELSAWAAGAEPGSAELDALRRERDELRERLEATPTAASEDEGTLAELQEKFDLALVDLQSQRDHIAVLEEQLAADSKPAVTDQNELHRLREERDELQRRLDEAAFPEDPTEELEELRARFEMAVEDVRRLKTENSELRQQSVVVGGEAENDWEAQKRRLLASLEGEGEPSDAERAEERATIQGTLQITDRVVAEKDREIEKLQAWLAETGSQPQAVDDQACQALLDEDAIVQEERERLAALEADLREKLRAVELELSVERAKISRAQAEIDEQQLELETLRAATSLAAETADGTAPKRRWLDKLGLGGEGS